MITAEQKLLMHWLPASQQSAAVAQRSWGAEHLLVDPLVQMFAPPAPLGSHGRRCRLGQRRLASVRR